MLTILGQGMGRLVCTGVSGAEASKARQRGVIDNFRTYPAKISL